MDYSIAGGLAPTIETYQADDLDVSHPDLIAYLARRLDVSSEVALAALGSCLLDPGAEERRAKYVQANHARCAVR